MTPTVTLWIVLLLVYAVIDGKIYAILDALRALIEGKLK